MSMENMEFRAILRAVLTVKAFLEAANFDPKLERWTFEQNLYASIMEAGFNPVRLKHVWDLGLWVITGRLDIYREERFEEGIHTRILHELHKRGLDAEEDHIDLSHQGRTLTVVVGVRESRRRRCR